MSAERRFIVRPGWVGSQSDEDVHFVGVAQLVRLYELQPGEYLVDDGRGRMPGGLTVLGPRFDGKYGRPG